MVSLFIKKTLIMNWGKLKNWCIQNMTQNICLQIFPELWFEIVELLNALLFHMNFVAKSLKGTLPYSLWYLLDAVFSFFSERFYVSYQIWHQFLWCFTVDLISTVYVQSNLEYAICLICLHMYVCYHFHMVYKKLTKNSERICDIGAYAKAISDFHHIIAGIILYQTYSSILHALCIS